MTYTIKKYSDDKGQGKTKKNRPKACGYCECQD